MVSLWYCPSLTKLPCLAEEGQRAAGAGDGGAAPSVAGRTAERRDPGGDWLHLLGAGGRAQPHLLVPD